MFVLCGILYHKVFKRSLFQFGMEEEKKEHEHEHHHKPNFTEKVRENPWIISSLVLGVLVVILLVTTFSGGLSGNISKDKAAKNLVTYLDTNIDPSISLLNVSEQAGLYLVTVGYQGQAIPVYVTKDGTSYTTALSPMIISNPSSSSTNTQQATVPKTTKPNVELYVFAYCPGGLQMEKAMLPVVSLLGSNINFTIRQIGAMHGDFEKVEAERQLSIEKLYPDKYLAYLAAFDSDTSCGTGDATCVATKVGAIYTKLGMDATAINNYMTANGDALFNAEVSNAGANGVSGSPTLFINGVEVQPSSRSPDAVKGTICNAFSTVPSACSQTLDTNQASAGFGSSSSSSSTASGTQCATA